MYVNVAIVLASFLGLALHFLGTVPSPRALSAVYTDPHKAPDVISLILFCLTTQSLFCCYYQYAKSRGDTGLDFSGPFISRPAISVNLTLTRVFSLDHLRCFFSLLLLVFLAFSLS